MPSKHLVDFTKQELLDLPLLSLSYHDKKGNLKFKKGEIYNEILLLTIPNRVHESGYGKFFIIGVKNKRPVNIITKHSDDLRIFYPDGMCVMDVLSKSGAIRLHRNNYKFFVNQPVSTTCIKLVCKDGSDIPEISAGITRKFNKLCFK